MCSTRARIRAQPSFVARLPTSCNPRLFSATKMADISKKELRDEITAFLKDANLATTTAKKVRQHLEKKLDTDLTDRRKEIDEMVMAWLKENQEDGNDDEPEEDEEESEEEEKKPKKRSNPAKKAKKKDSDSESEDEEGSDDEYSPKKKVAKKAKGGKKAKGSDSDSEEWKEPKKKPAKKAAGGGGKRGTGFTKVYNLSPELAEVVGAESMARHDVVKKIWAIIKERKLYDPKNKQFAICDDQMQKIFGVKRFRTFGMMKYLKDHFVD